jgi:xanthosine phosphorylase
MNMAQKSIYQKTLRAAKSIQSRVPHFHPKIGLILGSGLGELATCLTDAIIIPYEEIPEFEVSSVEGHMGQLVLGYLNGVPIACYQGRLHVYEGINTSILKIFVRTLKLLGCEFLIVTNAAGSMNMEAGPGSLMLISDHINFSFPNPLQGQNDEEFGSRFVPMENAYDKDLRRIIKATSRHLDIPLYEGVYLGVSGPSFETPAEIRAFITLGANAVGMSTVPEVIIARHCGLKVLGLSVVTNYAAGLSDVVVTHDETLKGAKQAASDAITLLKAFVKDEHFI